MHDFDAITGRPLRAAADEQPRYWCDHPARDWHIEAARRADAAASLARDIEREQDPLKRHSLQVRLAALTGEPAPVYVEPATRAEEKSRLEAENYERETTGRDPEADRAAQRYLNKTRRGRRK